MDWATFFKDNPLVIPAIATVTTAIFGYFFVRWNSTHNKNLEIQKKEYDRRAAILDIRIQEVTEYVDSLYRVIQAIRDFHRILMDDPKLLAENLKIHKQKYTSVAQVMDDSIRKGTSIDILQDNELQRLNKELSLLMYPKIHSQVDAVTKFMREGTSAMENISIESLDVPVEADKLVIMMKIRLDELAKAVK